MKPLLLIMIVLCAAGLALWFSAGEFAAPAGEDAVVPSAQTTAPLAASPRGLPDAAPRTAQESEQPRGAVEPGPRSQTAQSLLQTESLEDRRWAAHQLELAERYRNYDKQQLREELRVLNEAVADQSRTLFALQFANKIYQIQAVGDSPLPDPVRGPRGRTPLQESRIVTDPGTFATEAHIATLAIEEHAEFYELLDDQIWLRKQLEQ